MKRVSKRLYKRRDVLRPIMATSSPPPTGTVHVNSTVSNKVMLRQTSDSQKPYLYSPQLPVLYCIVLHWIIERVLYLSFTSIIPYGRRSTANERNPNDNDNASTRE